MMREDWKICTVLRYNFGGYFRHIKYILFSAFQKTDLVKSFLGPVEENNQIKIVKSVYLSCCHFLVYGLVIW